MNRRLFCTWSSSVVQYYGMTNTILREKAVDLRKKGKTYSEIQSILGLRIPKSTLSYWFQSVLLSKRQQETIQRHVMNNICNARIKAIAVNKEKKKKYIQAFQNKNIHLKALLKNKDIAKITLATLYWGEGSRIRRSALMFGNSDPYMIKTFLKLLDRVYCVDYQKLRCTVQCRADQDIGHLRRFWSKITHIPLSQFLKTQVDPRTVGKKTKKKRYKGVCRIDYYSADVYNELSTIIQILSGGL